MIHKWQVAVLAALIAVTLAVVLPTEPPTIPRTGSQNAPSGAVQGETVSLTLETVAQHATTADCWTIIEGTVYDVTSYVPFHPGGVSEISAACGADATALFTTSAGRDHSPKAENILAQYRIGAFGEAALVDQAVAKPRSSGSFEDAIKEEYPGAQITSQHREDNGVVEGKFIWQGDEYEFKADAAGNLLEVES